MFIYVIVCSESMKLYIGQHKGANLGKYLSRKFFDAHRYSGKRSHLYAAMRTYPRESWFIYPLVSGIESREELDVLEKNFIRVLKAQHPDIGYNICDGGEGFTGPHTPEWRAETKERLNRWYKTEEGKAHRVKVGKMSRERWRTNPEYRKNVTRSITGNKYRLGMKQSEEFKQYMRNLFQNRQFSEETRHRISESLTIERGVSVVCVDTGEIFDSLARAARAHKTNDGNIVRAIKINGVAGGKRWRYAK